MAALALVLAARVLKPDAGRVDAGRLDRLGFALLSPGLAAIVFGLSETESHGGIDHPAAFVPVVAGLLLAGLFVRHALGNARPLIDVTLFRSRQFSAAAAATLLIGAALFAAMLILPLYYQVDRGESALTAGLLMAPQGIGAALAMPLAGRLTDRVGGGPVVLAGSLVMTLGTLPLVFLSAENSHWLLAGTLVTRGVGVGASMMPAMAAAYAYAAVDSAQVPGATSALNALQRVGGSIGTALLAVVLQHQTRAALGGGGQGTLQPVPPGRLDHVAEPLATAFGHTFVWAAAITVAAILPAALLALTQRAAEQPAG